MAGLLAGYGYTHATGVRPRYFTLHPAPAACNANAKIPMNVRLLAPPAHTNITPYTHTCFSISRVC